MTTALEPALVAVPMMDATEARDTVALMRGDLTQIDTSLGSFRQRALDFAEREGWKALGYGGVAEAIRNELGADYSKSHLSRLLGAAKIEQVLQLPMGNSVPERVLREIGTLGDPAEQRAAWETAQAAAGGATPTTAQARAAVADVREAASDLPPLNPPGWETLKAAGWRLDTRLPGGRYRVFPPNRPGGYRQAARQLTADEIADLAAEHRGDVELITALCAETGAEYLGFADDRFQIGWPPRPSGGGGQYTAADALYRLRELAGARQPPAALSPLPEPLRHSWTRWRNDDGQIGMRHTSGYKLGGTDAAALEQQAAALARPLGELSDHGWRVFYDPGAEGRSDLHAYTAGHEEHDTISARTLPELALLAWKSRQHEDSGPNMPDDVIDALWLAGYDWSGTAWVRGFERINEDTNLPELRYQLGLTAADAMPHLPDGWAAAQARASRIGLYLGMNMAGMFSLTNLSGSVTHKTGKWTELLGLLTREEEKAARQAPAAAPSPVVDDPRARAAQLLTALAKILPSIDPPGNIEELSQAIADLNDCREGEEAQYWLSVGWALIDRAPGEGATT